MVGPVPEYTSYSNSGESYETGETYVHQSGEEGSVGSEAARPWSQKEEKDMAVARESRIVERVRITPSSLAEPLPPEPRALLHSASCSGSRPVRAVSVRSLLPREPSRPRRDRRVKVQSEVGSFSGAGRASPSRSQLASKQWEQRPLATCRQCKRLHQAKPFSQVYRDALTRWN